MNKESINSSKDNRFNNWIATVVFLFPFINGVIGVDGASLITIATIAVLFLLSIYQKEHKILPLGITIFLLISIIFIISFLRLEQFSYAFSYLLYFLAFNVLALFAGMQDVDINKTIEYSIVIGFVGVLVYWVRGTANENTGIQMAIAYAMLGVLFSSITGIFIGTKYRLLAVINVLLIFFLHVQNAPRGIWLSIAFYMAFLAFYIFTKNLNHAKGMIVKLSLVSIAAVFLFVFIFNMQGILLWINDMLIEKFDIHVYALWKFSFYLEKGDLLNGRSELWGSAMSAIREGGLLGNGIGYFESTKEGSHAHNIILQALCEAGIIFGIPLAYMLLKSVRILIGGTNRMENKKYLYFLLLFLYGDVMLFYSSVHWLWVPFWFFVGYFIRNRKSFAVSIAGERNE